jgi:hypothetical protein
LESQNISLFLGELKHEVLRKSVKISFHSLVEVEGFHPLEHSQVTVQHNFVLTDEVDPPLDHFSRDNLLLGSLFLCHGPSKPTQYRWFVKTLPYLSATGLFLARAEAGATCESSVFALDTRLGM